MSKFSFSNPDSHAGIAKSLHRGQQASLAQAATSLELEFVFLPTDEAFSGGFSPHPGPWKNPNRQGTPLAFWRKVKDALRHLTGNDYRGSYVAPGPHGRRNNIERQPLPGRGIDLPGSGQEGVGQLASRRPRLEVPALPPFSVPDHLDQLPLSFPPLSSPPVAIQNKPIRFQNFLIKPDEPVSYKQDVHFIGDTDSFINRLEAQQVMRELLKLMQDHPNVNVTILGNAATDFATPAFKLPYGHNKALLRKSPLYGYYDGKAYYGSRFRTIGDLMLARARAIAKLLTSQGIAPGRIRCDIGTYGYGKIGVPGSGGRKRRATIIISEKP